MRAGIVIAALAVFVTIAALAEMLPLPAEGFAGPAAFERFFEPAGRPAPKPPARALPQRGWPAQARPAPRPGSGAPRAHAAKLRPARLLVAVPAASPAYRYTFRALLSRPDVTDGYDPLILRYAERNRLNPRLLKAIIAAESEFMRRATSPRGARGLMQLTPATAGEMGVPPEALEDPEANIRAGAAYLGHLFARARRRYPSRVGSADSQPPLWLVERVIAAYNAGPSFLIREKMLRETRDYVEKVVLFMQSPVTVLRRHAAAPSDGSAHSGRRP